MSNFPVFSWNGKGGYVPAVTGLDGTYELAVRPGRWKVGYEIPKTSDGSASPYLQGEPKSPRVKQGETVVASFQLSEAKSPMEGTITNANGEPIIGLEAWAYARKASDEDDDFDFVAESRIDERGRFEINLPEGEFLLGVWLPDDAPYSTTEETKVDPQDSTASIVLKPNAATISGKLTLDGKTAVNLIGEVYAVA